jgi:hypothetical protein
VSEETRDALTWGWETAMMARLQHEDAGRESLASIYRGYEEALSALLSAPEPAETGRMLEAAVLDAWSVLPSSWAWSGAVTAVQLLKAEILALRKERPAPTAASEVEPAYTGDGTETLEGWVAPYSEGLWTFEEGEADPHPTSIRASLVLRGIPKFGGHWAEVRVGAPTAAEPEREAPTPEKLRAMAEWLDDPANPMAVDDMSGYGLVSAGYLLRRIAYILEEPLATPEAEGGST